MTVQYVQRTLFEVLQCGRALIATKSTTSIVPNYGQRATMVTNGAAPVAKITSSSKATWLQHAGARKISAMGRVSMETVV